MDFELERMRKEVYKWRQRYIEKSDVVGDLGQELESVNNQLLQLQEMYDEVANHREELILEKMKLREALFAVLAMADDIGNDGLLYVSSDALLGYEIIESHKKDALRGQKLCLYK